MSHEVETMAWTNEVPWHGLGNKVEGAVSVDEFRKLAGLDWEVEKVDTYVKLNGKYVKSGDQKLIRDKDNHIFRTTVSPDWIPFTMEEQVNYIKEIEEIFKGQLIVDTAGSLREGEIVWYLMKIVGESFEVIPNDRIDAHFLVTNFYQYGKATDARWTPIRAVCMNTLSQALARESKNAVKVSHRQQFNPDYVNEALGITHDKMAAYKETAQFLVSKKAKRDDMVAFLKEIFPGDGLKTEQEDENLNVLSRQGRMAYEALDYQPGVEFGEGTWWQAVNAVTYTVDHLRNRTQQKRLESAWYGSGASKKNKAMALAVDYANKSPDAKVATAAKAKR